MKQAIALLLAGALLVCPVLAAEPSGELYEVRMELWEVDDASGKMAREQRSTQADDAAGLTEYYSGMTDAARRAVELTDRFLALENERDPQRRDPQGADGERLLDADNRRKRNERAQRALLDSYENGEMTERKYHIQLLPLLRQERAIAEEAGRIRWESVTRDSQRFDEKQDELWEAKYQQYLAGIELEAVEYALESRAMTKTAYLSRRTKLKKQEEQAQKRVEKALTALRKSAQAGEGVMSERTYQGYYEIVARLEEIEKEKKRIGYRRDDGTLTETEYLRQKRVLEAEERQLKEEKRAYGYSERVS